MMLYFSDTLIQRVYSDHEPVDSKMVVGSSVGSIAGLLIITVIILTTILCIRRSKRNNTGSFNNDILFN